MKVSHKFLADLEVSWSSRVYRSEIFTKTFVTSFILKQTQEMFGELHFLLIPFERHKYTMFMYLSKTTDFHKAINPNLTRSLEAKI